MRQRNSVVLLDDQQFILELLGGQLAALGCAEVSGFQDAEQALARLADTAAAVDVVFCDLNMPQMDGLQFMRRLGELGYAGAVVLMSAEHERVLATAEKLAASYRLRLLGTLQKPIRPGQLEALLGRLDAGTPGPARGAERALSAAELREGVRRGELVIYYQPTVELATGTVRAFECLARWQHPRHGLVPPDEFIGVAEDGGVIDELTAAVLAMALAQARRWREAGLDLRVAVNVSADNLAQTDFAERVMREAEQAGVPPATLVLEVTETRVMSDRVLALEALTRLRLRRVGLAIDDFGTGHSSLAQLRDVPFTGLKVDRSFVHGASHDAARRAILEASLDMAKKLGLETIAEGVEDEDDWRFLRSSGCGLAQGYFIARPLPAEELTDWLRAWEARRRLLFH